MEQTSTRLAALSPPISGGMKPPSLDVEGGAGGGGGRIYPWGDDWDPAKCNTKESGVGDTTPVGQYSPQGDSPYGCADMAGNAWEWCADWFDEDAYKNQADGVKDPQGPEQGIFHVLRGGIYFFDRRSARAACRDLAHPIAIDPGGGFRVAVGASPISLAFES